jgi:hypothetical protein
VIVAEGPLSSTVRKESTIDQLKDDVKEVAIDADVVYGDNVGMVQRPCGSCFEFEAFAAAFVASDPGRQDFQCNITAQAGIASAVYFAHDSLADGHKDPVGTQKPTGNE